jgi:hypothetical protein
MITIHNRMPTQAPARPRIIRSSTQPQADARTPVTAPTRIHERTP